METGTPYYARMNNYTYAKHHRTLAVFPFTAPYTVTSPPASVVTAPWDLTCEYYYEVQTLAVFGGKIYYVCQVIELHPLMEGIAPLRVNFHVLTVFPSSTLTS